MGGIWACYTGTFHDQSALLSSDIAVLLLLIGSFLKLFQAIAVTYKASIFLDYDCWQGLLLF